MATNGTTSSAKLPSAVQAFNTEMPMKLMQTMMQGMGAYQQEMSQFVAKRLADDAGFQERLSGCKDAASMFAECSDFTRKVMQDYLGETRKLQAMAFQMLSKGSSAASTGATV